MASFALFHGREADAMVEGLRQAKQRGQRVSNLSVRETVIGPAVMSAIVDLLQDESILVDSVHLDDCGAYLNAEATSMAKVLGNVRSLRLSEPTFLSPFFLDSLLQSAKHLTELHIQDDMFFPQIEALSRGLEYNRSLRVLDLSRSRLEDPCNLWNGLRVNQYLKEIRFKSMGITDRNMEDMLEAIKFHPTLTLIDVSFNHCRTMDHMAHYLELNTTVRGLSIGYMNVWQATKVDVKYFLESMQTNTTLESLSMAWDKLDDTDAEYVADMLRANSTLRSLDIKENRLTDAGIICIADALRCNTTLRSINVRNNAYGIPGLTAMLQVVQRGSCLECVDMPSNYTEFVQQIDYYTALNMGGRRYAHADLPLGLWPHVIQRIDNDDWEDRPANAQAGYQDAIYYHLRGPLMFEGMLCRHN